MGPTRRTRPMIPRVGRATRYVSRSANFNNENATFGYFVPNRIKRVPAKPDFARFSFSVVFHRGGRSPSLIWQRSVDDHRARLIPATVGFFVRATALRALLLLIARSEPYQPTDPFRS